MATLSVSYDTGPVPLSRITDAFADAYGWTATITNGGGVTVPNPETKAQFMRRKVGEYIRDVVRGQELDAARRTAEAGVTGVTLT